MKPSTIKSCVKIASTAMLQGLLRFAFAAVLLLACSAGNAGAQQPATPPALTPPIGTTQQITVTADRTPAPVGETAKTVETLDSEQLDDYPAPVLDDTLRQHAGFELFRRSSSRVTNPTSQGISLRGLGSTAASRTLVLEDGAPLNDPFGGWIHWNESPPSTIDEVTIVHRRRLRPVRIERARRRDRGEALAAVTGTLRSLRRGWISGHVPV